ncbi:glycolate oxidase subunit GlcE [Limibaculum sp. M0105]|uniref:Glycolate oxidase subunit GlcE n=1 Tax=Thermohalobaculum xanthum TaxID=2753746 RepID=A0A8J7M7R7_9RHOB|nr:glycolate oxidase subunit GlcE [Thermohalobaculum xanthum]MBK0399228.1 glycolate oxidase subunit GlcE [Thermohalobaculum xanthum]
MTPASEAELSEAVAAAAAVGQPLEIAGGGTRRGLGRPVQAEGTLSTSGIRGIRLYEPGALTLVVAAGTPLAEIEAALDAEGQRLPFEPMDHRALLGGTGEPTIGGAVACGASGPRRIQAGACRDAMIGVRFVNGRGEALSNGGRVMKNVTGYDLVKLMAGSYGTLGVLTEVGFKVLPRPERALTLVLEGLAEDRAVAALSAAVTAPFDVNGAAHLPARADAPARTLVRVEGLEAQAEYRAASLARLLAPFGEASRVDGDAHEALWRHVRDAERFAGREGAVWRLSMRPSDTPGAVGRIREATGADAFYDWAGGLVWLCLPETGDAGAAVIRAETARLGGHATLVRAAAATRAAVEVFEPEPAPLARISAGLRASFDPSGILNPGRMRA